MSALGAVRRLHRRERLSAAARREDRDQRQRLHDATFGLAETKPHLSAHQVVTPAQVRMGKLAVLVMLVVLWAFPHTALQIAVTVLSAGFVYSVILRCMLAAAGTPVSAEMACDEALPLYSILVPVYHEAGMIPQLARALAALDYPRHKLDILLVVEEDDGETRTAVRLAGLNAVVVPPSEPRTKPKACNYALQQARGEFVVVYDAEDRPEPDQLRKAVAAFRKDPGMTCVQARLAIDRRRVWLTQMFAIDYDLWFRLLLPGLSRLGGPIPLGGTSNHFRRTALIEVGAWDPFNVTEDADLGMRLARLGHRVSILDSVTYEEAPERLGSWLRQRTRWMKGYMQTLLVHGRNPAALVGEIGGGGVSLILAFLGGAVWSSLVNPVMWILCFGAAALAPGETGLLVWLARISGSALLMANAALIVLAMARARRRAVRTAFVLTYPLYWLLISVAAYRAVWQLLREPFLWEKTPHGAARR